MNTMPLPRTSHGPVDVLSFSDNLNAVTAPALRLELKDLIQTGRSRLVMDMSGVRFVDSSGLSVFVVALKAARAAGGDVVLLKLTPEVRSIVELTRLHRVFEIFDDVDAAIAKLAQP
jgi:anti-sigma B factor antagonist